MTLETYDFFIYGTAAALVFGELFFPNSSPGAALMASFATFGAGFLARPIGAILGGHIGDKYGRKVVLIGALTLMGVSTSLIGFLPTHATIGLAAPGLLLLLRLLQGLSVGAEWGAAALMGVESAPPGRRGFFGSFTQMGSSGGMLLAVGAFAATRALTSEEAFMAWGWRIPFIASALVVVIGLIIRAKLHETEEFQDLQGNDQVSKRPLVDLMRNESRNVWLTAGMRVSQNALYYLYTTFSVAYMAGIFGKDSNIGLNAVLAASVIGLFTVPFWGSLSDRIGRRPLYIFGAIGGALFFGPFFWLIDTGSGWLVAIGMVIALSVFHDSMYGPQAAFFAELFSTKVRLSGASAGYNIGSVLAGFSPFIAAALLTLGGGKPWLVVAYVIFISSITVVCAFLAPETNGAATRMVDRQRASRTPLDTPETAPQSIPTINEKL